MSEQAEIEVMKGLATLLREYREVAERIVMRYSNNNCFLLAADKKRLAHLNKKVDEIEAILKKSLSVG